AIARRALLLAHLDALEVAERGDARAAHLGPRLAVELALHQRDLAPDHRVAGLRVAGDVDPLDAHGRPAADDHRHVHDAPLHVEIGLGADVDEGVALVAIAPGDAQQARGDARSIEPVARVGRDELAQRAAA